MSSYCYLVSKTGIMDDSHRLNSEAGSFKEDTDKVIDTVVKLYDAIVLAVLRSADRCRRLRSVRN